MKRLAVLVLLSCAASACADGPLYQGRSTAEWARDLGSPEVPVRLAAISALGEFGADGKEAVPLLLQMLKERDMQASHPGTLGMVGHAAANSLARIGPAAVPGLVQALGSSQPRVRAGAALALGQIRPGKANVVAALKDALKDRDEHVRFQTALALVRLGQQGDAIAVLVDLLRGLTPAVRIEAVSLLRLIGPPAKSGAAPLVEAMRDEHLEMPATAPLLLQQGGLPAGRWSRNLAVDALAAIGADAVPALTRATDDREPEVRAGALLALASMQPARKEAIEALRKGLRDRDSQVRLVAAINHWRLTRDPAAALPVLLEALKAPDADQATVAGFALGLIGPKAREAIPTLVGQLREAGRAEAAAQALRLFGAEVVPALVALLGDDELSARVVTLLQGMIEDAAPALLRALESNRATVRAAAAEALATSGPHAPYALPGLRDAARDIDSRVRFQAFVALAFLDLAGPSDETAKALGAFLRQKNFPHRQRAVFALAFMGSRAAKAIPDLEATLDDSDVPLRRSVAAVLHPLAPENRKAVDVLIDMLKETASRGGGTLTFHPSAAPRLAGLLKEGPNPFRVQVLLRLSAMGPQAEPAASAVAGLLTEGQLAGQAALVLVGIGPKAKEHLPALEKACRQNPAARIPPVLVGLGHMGPDGITTLRRLAAEGSPARGVAIQALGIIRDRAPATLEVLASALKDKETAVRQQAARALLHLGREEQALPVLREWLADPDIVSRRQAVLTLGTEATESPRLVTLLVDALKDHDAATPLPPARGTAGLGVFGITATPGAFGLQGQLGAIGALGLAGVGGVYGVGGGVPGFGGGLVGFGGVYGQFGSIASVRMTAISSLGQVGPAAKNAVPALQALLADEDPGTRAVVATALGQIGPRARAALPELRKALKDAEPEVRRAAAAALARLDPKETEAVAVLVAAMKEPSPGLLDSPGRDLVPLGKAAVPALIALLNERHTSPGLEDGYGLFAAQDGAPRAAEAAHYLGLIGPDAAEAIPVLLEVVQDRRYREPGALEPVGPSGFSLRFEAARAVGKIGPKSQKTVATLLAVARDRREELWLRVAALESAVRLDPQAGGVIPVAKELMHALLLHGQVFSLEPIRFVATLGPGAKELTPLLIGYLERFPAGTIRIEVIRLLASLPADREAVPALKRLLNEPSTRLAAILALEAHDGPEATAARLLEALSPESGENPLRAEAVARFGKMKAEHARKALPVLWRLLGDADPFVRVRAAAVLLKHTRDEKAVPPLQRGLESGDTLLRKATLEALRDAEAMAPPLVELVKELREDSDREIRELAVALVKKIQ